MRAGGWSYGQYFANNWLARLDLDQEFSYHREREF